MSADRVLAVAYGDYAKLPKLEQAIPDAETLVKLLGEHQFEGDLLSDARRGALLDKADELLAPGSLKDGTLVLLWIGHGELGPNGTLRLMGRTGEASDAEVTAAANLGEWATRTGAAQILVLLDCCFSGEAVPDTLGMANAVLAGRADVKSAWFGCVAASRGDERARSGVMMQQVERLLRDGPTDPRERDAWRLYSEKIPGDRFIDALAKGWSEERHTPRPATLGSALPMLPNPLYRAGVRNAVVEHLLFAARGTSTEANFFTGRRATLARIVTWMRTQTPGLCVVTGPPGSGKSALVGRVVSLSVSAERALLDVGDLPPEVDPGESSVDANVHLRQLDLNGVVEELAVQLGLDEDADLYAVLGCASRRRAENRPLVVAFDGLDEAGDEGSHDIALRLITPLAREALVLVGTREVPGASGEPGLLSLLAPFSEMIDLGLEEAETLEDMRTYTLRRLDRVSPVMNPKLVADALVELARRADPGREGPFLLARLITSQLRAEPVDTAQEHWRSALATSVEAAFEYDLRRCVLMIDGREHPTAARELMTALACAYGGGLPADDVWPAIATELSPTGTVYTRDHVFELLFTLGRHIISATERDQAVFRVAHQRLVDQLRPMVGEGVFSIVAPAYAEPVAHAVAALYGRLLDQGLQPRQHTYLWRYAWRHFADAGLLGIQLLRGFVERDREQFLPDLAWACGLVARECMGTNRTQDAVRLYEEEASIYRALDDSMELAITLSRLAIARSMNGDTEGGDSDVDEAVRVIDRMKDDPERRPMLAFALLAQAVVLLRQGSPRTALRLARKSIEMFDAERAEGEAMPDEHAAVCVIAATAALVLDDLAVADELSQHALEILDSAECEDSRMIEALAGRAQVELQLMRQGVSADAHLVEPTAGPRLLEIHRRTGATGTLNDILMGEGLRYYALTLHVAGRDEPDPGDLLDSAIDLAQRTARDSADAALSLACSLAVRAGRRQDSAGKIEDLVQAEEALRAFAAVSPAVALQLGSVISQQVRDRVNADDEDLESLLDRQREAVALIEDVRTPAARPALASALSLLYLLLTNAGRFEDSLATLQHTAYVQRQLYDTSGGSPLPLAATLADLASRLAGVRPLEVLELGAESRELVRSSDDAGARLIRSQVEGAIAAANLVLNREEEGKASLEESIRQLEPMLDQPVAPWLMTNALSNLAGVHLRAGAVQEAIQAARRAVELAEERGTGPNVSLLPLAQSQLGIALHAAGEREAANTYLGPAIGALKTLIRQDEGVGGILAMALEAAGPEAWDAVLSELEDQPTIGRQLKLLRFNSSESLPALVAEYVRVLAAVADEPQEVRSVRQLARGRRSNDTEQFDAAWRAAAGDLPDWLLIPEWLDLVVVAWWNAPTWRRARDYLESTPTLLDPMTVVVLEEVRNEHNNGLVDLHLQILETAIEEGIDAAYGPIFADELVDEWIDADLEEAFLAEHRDELLGDHVAAALADRAADGDVSAIVAQALLVLSRRGEESVAHSVLDGQTSLGIALLETAWRSADAERLGALAVLCQARMDDNDPMLALVTVARAIAEALLGRRDVALEFAAEAATAADEESRQMLVNAVLDALSRNADQPDGLLAIVRVLRGEPGPA